MRLPGWSPYPAVVLSFALGFWQKWPCHSAGWPYQRALIFGQYCYSDLPVLYDARGLADGRFPYATAHSFEYPVLTGYLADVTARMVHTHAGYYLLNSVILLVCTLVTVWAVKRLASVEAALIVALSPVLALTGTINWDMVPVMFTVLALLAWTRDKPELAGLAIGLGAATKFYPALLLFPLLLSRQWTPFLKAFGAAIASWIVVNLPVMVLYFDGWLEFFRLNQSRRADFGSIWYGLQAYGIGPITPLNLIAVLLLGACLVAIAFFAPRNVFVLSFLTVAAFLITNKVYSPQYVLWLLPLAVLAGAPLWSLAGWQLAELGYWWAVWRYLAWEIPPEQYAAFIFTRLAAVVVLTAAILIAGTGRGATRTLPSPRRSYPPDQAALQNRSHAAPPVRSG